jgi:hypothetical protein
MAGLGGTMQATALSMERKRAGSGLCRSDHRPWLHASRGPVNDPVEAIEGRPLRAAARRVRAAFMAPRRCPFP